jgi:hypothetical protein
MPPLGCSFHPRCPRAFEVCGWEARDLRTLLEDRWTKLDERSYEAERAAIGDLESLEPHVTEAVVPAGSGHSGADALKVLEAMKADQPADPIWRGVASMEAESEGVRVRFRDPFPLRDLEVGAAQLRCHLYDTDALIAAGRQGSEPGGGTPAS